MQSLANDYRLGWRPFLTLGRVSNLGTVWSNCLAAWALSGGGPAVHLLTLVCGMTCLYLGGMFLNDAFDVEHDRLHRPSRPIPSGLVNLSTAWKWAMLWLAAGVLLLVSLGPGPGLAAVLLALMIVVYDAVHKAAVFSPVLLGGCRCLLYWIAGVATPGGASGMAIWGGIVLGLYVTGLSFLARVESRKQRDPRWPCLLLAVPVGFALLANAGSYRLTAVLLSLGFVLWTGTALYYAYALTEPQLSRAVAALLAGIIWVDLLLVLAAPPGLAVILALLFLGTLVAQRSIPAS
jgi:4-hydroxybenzoate polyprenyltransferase